jgi:hypothetical protein
MKTTPTKWPILLVFAVVAVTSGSARADQLRFESGEKRVSFVELFTSEGCSSCPPAERTLSKLTTHPSLWKTFVPVAFHVNYWDNVGWKDRLASVEFRKFTHDFVALVHHQSPLHGHSLRAEFKPDENSGGSRSRALAAWVSVGSDPTPIQATGGWLSLQH